MVAKVCQVVLVAMVTLATQLALVTPSVLESLATWVTWLTPERLTQESQVGQPVPFHIPWGHPTLRGLVQTLHLELEFWSPLVVYYSRSRGGPGGPGCRGLG